MSNQSWNPFELLQQTWNQACSSLQSMSQSGGTDFHRQVETWAETFGQVMVPIADFPLLKPLSKTPGLGWLAAALGQVNLASIHQEMETLHTQQAHLTPEQLAQRVIQETAVKAAGIGLATNFLPPLAITLFAVDIAAIATLQVELIYRLAAVYGYDIQDKKRRGEILALYLCSAGGSTLIKSGLSFPEIIPGVGAVIGASGDAVLLWSIGQAANQYYQTKRSREVAAAAEAAAQPETIPISSP